MKEKYIRHGTEYGYKQGCRCYKCRSMAAFVRSERRKHLSPEAKALHLERERERDKRRYADDPRRRAGKIDQQRARRERLRDSKAPSDLSPTLTP